MLTTLGMGDDDNDTLGKGMTELLRCVAKARRRWLGPFSPDFNPNTLLGDGLHKVRW